MLGARNQRGDTIIEVVFAVTIFGLVAIAGLSLMNQGTALAQRALEIGLVRQQIDAQADTLRYLNRAYIADYGQAGAATIAWQKIVESKAVTQADNFATIAGENGCNLPADGKAFALNLKKFSAFLQDPAVVGNNPSLVPVNTPPTFSQVRYVNTDATAEGLWIQAVRWPDLSTDSAADPKPESDKKPGYYDFHIRACWYSPGQALPITLGTIVRLYEPRG